MRCIIVGPKRCGKTHFAKCLAGQDVHTALIDDFDTPGGLQEAVGNRDGWVVVVNDLQALSQSERELADVIFERVKGSRHDFRTRIVRKPH